MTPLTQTQMEPERTARLSGPALRAWPALRRVAPKSKPLLSQTLLERLTGSGIPKHLRNSDYLFIHVPKNAGIATAYALYGRPVWPKVWHRTALQIKTEYPDFFSTRMSFAIVRNPWDRVVSAYEYLRAGGTRRAPLARKTAPPRAMVQSFEVFCLEYLLPNNNRLQMLDEVLWEQNVFVNDAEGNCLVDYLAPFEELDRFEDLLAEHNVIHRPLKHLNQTPTRVTQDYRNYFTTPKLVDAIATCYAKDAVQFLYEF